MMPKRSHSPSVGEMTMRGLCAHTGMATPPCDHGPLGVSDTMWLMYLHVSVDVGVMCESLSGTNSYMVPKMCARHMRTLERYKCAEQGCNRLHPRIPQWHMDTIMGVQSKQVARHGVHTVVTDTCTHGVTGQVRVEARVTQARKHAWQPLTALARTSWTSSCPACTH